MLAAIVAVGLLSQPVQAHITGQAGHNWNKHYRNLAQALFFTRAQSDARFAALGHTHALPQHDHDARYFTRDQATNAFAPFLHDHDARYFTQVQLSDSDGTSPNVGSNRVHWNNLAGVPDELADGTDATGNLAAYCASLAVPSAYAPCTTPHRQPVDTADFVGTYTSIAIGTDGNPVVAYYKTLVGGGAHGDLKVARCLNPTCSTGADVVLVDTDGDVGQYTSIAIGTDGNPVISYYDVTNQDLKVAKCGNPACSAGNVINAVDTNGTLVGWETTIAIGPDGNPVISYYEMGTGALRAARCGNPACSTGNVINEVDYAGYTTSMAIGTDGFAVIAYHFEVDPIYDDLKVAHCADSNCSTVELALVDTEGSVGQGSSIAIGTDGNPVISYYDFTNQDLKVVRCGNLACSAGNVLTPVDTVGNVGPESSIAIGTDGNPGDRLLRPDQR